MKTAYVNLSDGKTKYVKHTLDMLRMMDASGLNKDRREQRDDLIRKAQTQYTAYQLTDAIETIQAIQKYAGRSQ